MQRIAHDTRSFDGFMIDLTRGCLLRGAEEVKLQPKPFGALTYLVENPGRLIEKAELIQVLWPDTAVTDDSLVQCIGDVRRALGDETQQIIRTVTRRGYIFDRPVTSGPTALTTYTEEKSVQIIIEERETNGHAVAEASAFPTPLTAGLISAHKATSIERLTTAIKQHRRAAAIGVLSVALVAAGIVYFTRPSEAIDSVAVMPLVNVNKDPNTDYLAQGISDNIIDRLSHLPNLKKVIALNSVLRYKGTQTDPQAVGRELNVRAVLMGQLVQRGDELSLSLELVDVRDSKHLWSGQYNRKATDMIALQAEIAQEIVEKLRLPLSGDEKKQLNKTYTQSGEAYQLYMMGRYYFRRSGKREDLLKSIDYFEQAIKKDPSYAPAYAGLGTTYHLLGFMGWMLPKESWQKEEWAALKALQIDDQLPEAHVLTAAIREFNLDWTGAEEEYKRALELDPNSVRAHETYAWHLEMFGRFDDAMSHLKRAQELDPLSLELMWNMGVWLSFSRQYDRAIEQLQKIIEMDSEFEPAHTFIAETYQKKGMYEEAIAELKSAHVSGPPLGYAYAVAGKRDEAQKILNDLKEQSKQGYVSPKAFAMVYMGLGDKDQAFEWFNKTVEENPYRIAWLKVDPRFDSLRSDPRFDALLRRMKLVS
ncbi:MAG TPA: tetratricopeptide repeat protein [Pyrinomonadaceae bacterium]|nr:tetratricopeptide repeat protein [Pyrinomonadaceae bacterium]